MDLFSGTDHSTEDPASGATALPLQPRLQRIVHIESHLTDDGAFALAVATELDRLALLWLAAPAVTEAGRAALRKRFDHRVGIFSGGTPRTFSRSRPFPDDVAGLSVRPRLLFPEQTWLASSAQPY